jgi:hypothetical protein
VTPTTARVVDSLDTPTGSPVVVLESREAKAPKVVSKEAEKREGRNSEFHKVERIRLRPEG